jgi:hypothetical protein
VLLGKILRITPNGEIPIDNPFSSAVADRCNTTGRTTAGRKCRETFAWGLRNPFRFAFDPNATGTRFFINDVGQSTWEEIDEGQSGADYGWNVREGPCGFATADCGGPPPGMTNPVYAYDHSAGCGAITGGAFVPNGVWPSQYDGGYLYGDFVCGKIVRLEPSGTGGYSPIDFATGLGSTSAVHMRFGPWNGPFGSTQALYYTTYASGGEVRRIGYTAGLPPVPQPPPPPTVRISAIRYDAPGLDRRIARSLNREWVRLRNASSQRVTLTGWTLRDRQGHVYRFGVYALAAGASVTIHTGPGRNRAADRYWRRARHVWGNTRDRATLHAATGTLVDVCAYANARADLRRC